MASTVVGRYRRGLRQYMDSTYIASLFPVITPDEFAASIARINVAYRPNAWMYVVQLLTLSLVLVGFILFGYGAHLSVAQFGFSPLVAVGFIMFLVGAILGGVSNASITSAMRTRLLAALCVENAYYSQKCPPATFRLRETHIIRSRGGRHVNFNIVIDVGAQVMQPSLVNVTTNNYYQPSPMQGAPVQYAMGATPVMQPSSPPRFYNTNAVAPAPPMMQQQPYYGQQQQPYGQQSYGQQQYGAPQQPQQYWQQQQQQQQPPPMMMQQAPNRQQQPQLQYYNQPYYGQQQPQPQPQQPPAYMTQAALPYQQQQQPQPFEEPVKPAVQISPRAL